MHPRLLGCLFHLPSRLAVASANGQTAAGAPPRIVRHFPYSAAERGRPAIDAATAGRRHEAAALISRYGRR